MNQYTPKQDIKIRFWSKVKIGDPDECWNWLAGLTSTGYGMFNFDNKPLKASRVAWMLTSGEIPNNLCVCHKCDNPLCCNPKHLFLGTRKENSEDMVKKGRQSRGKKHGDTVRGELNPVHKLTWDTVREIRMRYGDGNITMTQLAKEYSVDRKLIHNIVYKKAWKEGTE